MVILPLYPQYSATTTASVNDAVSDWMRQQRLQPELQWINQYAEAPGYLAALAAHVQTHWAQADRGERILFSFHGIPQRYADLGDPYPEQCRATATALATRLGLEDGRWACAYQSRFGPTRWVGPYTDQILTEWADAGVRTVDVLCPGFAADCLETLEEIAIRYAAILTARGGQLRYIPALNDAPDHVAFLADLVWSRTAPWRTWT